MKRAVPTPPARGVVDPAMCRHPRTSEVRATVVNGWDVRPTLDRVNANRRPLAQAAGSFVAGSPLPQALIQCRQRLTYELRLGKLVIPLSCSAPQPVADDSAVALALDGLFTGLDRAPERTGDSPPRHIPSPTSLRAHHCVPSSVHVRPCSKGPHSPTSSGSAFPIKNGSEFSIGPTRSRLLRFSTKELAGIVFFLNETTRG